MDHDRPELRERVKAELLYPTRPFDPDAQARQMWDEGYSVGDIAAIQRRSLGEVARAIQGVRDAQAV